MPTTPSDVAKAINVSVSTVRNWTKEFGQHLSPAARGEEGNRAFDARDMEVMRYIAQLRGEGMLADDIRARLAETEFGQLADYAELPPAAPQAPPQPESTRDMQTAMLQVHTAALERISDRLLDRDSAGVRQVRSEVAQLRTLVWILCAVVLVLVVAVVALWVVG